ncbi:DUF6055 domain-containing protein [Prevotella communis]|uniref:DUF6055 domain-containing protein n=1 Tax=Prevotella communis TaxID=2913614 RepID=UPI001EDB8946|nr:DUF6055 domain-containing protein [Prevotella communis]UKK67235.1 DUF6055 domain-containing protein [Prevotella communis]UKK70625.1 DUF6055 domain-containing protein [Prevotella communis]
MNTTIKCLCLITISLVSNLVYAQKKLYIPKDLQGMNLKADTSKWSLNRSIETDDLIFMWERGFGNDVSNPPQLKGHDMSFNLLNLRDRIQTFYHFFRDTLGFVTPNYQSKADHYKMMVMVNYSLDGTAYGGTYDNFIGALWVAPNRIQDTKMNCMAHELGHSFQAQIMADSIGQCWGGTGFFEMASQWMLWQVNPDWITDENYHFEAFKTLTHKAFLHMDNIYHSPYVLQWWSDLHGRQFIAELFRQGVIGEDPVMTYKRMNGLSQSAFCDEIFRGYQHLVNFDFTHAYKETRQYAATFNTELETCSNGWLRPKLLPEGYGFNAIKLDNLVNLNSPIFHLHLRGNQLRYGFVGITTNGESIYSDVNATSFTSNGQPLKHLFLIIMGAPEHHADVMTHGNTPEYKQYPYEFQVTE